MKGLREWFRLGMLALLALTLMVVLALPASADSHKVCSSSQMLDEVEIVSVAAKESPAVWSAQGLVNFDYGGDIENGLLEVRFKDIATDFDFDGYIIEATPGTDDPGDSAELGVEAYTLPELIARPAVVGATVTEVLNLEPGTKYYVTVHAVNHNTVQISPDQRAQDSAQSSATTLLSAPFLGALAWVSQIGTTTDGVFKPTVTNGQTQFCAPDNGTTCRHSWPPVGLADEDFQGAHFAFYDARNEAGQHYFRWLNPDQFGPFDHLLDRDDVWDYDPTAQTRPSGEQADMLSLDKDGELEDHCADADITAGDCGHTHYQFKALDENGNTVASELVETNGSMNFISGNHYIEVVFSAEEGDLTLSVSLGRMVDDNYKAMSDTASVMFEAPDDLRAFDQTYDEYFHNLIDITGDYDENEDAKRWLGENESGANRSIWNREPERAFSVISRDYRHIIRAHLNNQLK